MRRCLHRCITIWSLTGGILLLAIVAVTTINVGAFVLDATFKHLGWRISGLPGYEDFVRLTVGTAVLMLMPWCQLQRSHITVSFFTDRLLQKNRRRLEIFWHIVMAAIALFLCGWMTVGMIETRADHALSPVLGWIEWPFYLPGVISLLLWAIAAVMIAADTWQYSDGT